MKYKACETLLKTCAQCKPEEKILIVTDPKSLPVAMALWEDAAEYPNKSLVMMPMQSTHGQEPTALVRAAMMEADVIFRVTSFSISNTEARRAACANGARDVNCADYDMRMLSSGGLYADFEALVPLVNRTAERLRGSLSALFHDRCGCRQPDPPPDADRAGGRRDAGCVRHPGH